MAVRSLQRSNLVNTVRIDRGVVLCPYIQVLIPWSPHKSATVTIAAAPPRQIPTFWLIHLSSSGLTKPYGGGKVWWPSRQECLWPAGKAAWAALTATLLGNISALGTAGDKGIIKPGEVFWSKSRFTPAPRRVSVSQKFATVLSSASHFVPLPRGTLWLTRTHPEVSGWFGLISDHLRAWAKATSSHMSSRTISRWVQANGCCKESIAPPAASLVFQNVHLFLLLFFPLVLICIVITPQTECSMGISLSLDTSWILKA